MIYIFTSIAFRNYYHNTFTIIFTIAKPFLFDEIQFIE